MWAKYLLFMLLFNSSGQCPKFKVMVKINQFDEDVYLLHDGSVIGLIHNIMQIQDIRVQIRKGELSGYAIKYNGNLIYIGSSGNFQPGMSKLLPFYEKWMDMCSELF